MKNTIKAVLATAAAATVLGAAACSAPAAIEKAASTATQTATNAVTQSAATAAVQGYLQGIWSCKLNQGDEVPVLNMTAVYAGSVAILTVEGSTWKTLTKSTRDDGPGFASSGDFAVDGTTLKVTPRSYGYEDGSPTYRGHTPDQRNIGKTFAYTGVPEDIGSPAAGPTWLKTEGGDSDVRLDATAAYFTLTKVGSKSDPSTDDIVGCMKMQH